MLDEMFQNRTSYTIENVCTYFITLLMVWRHQHSHISKPFYCLHIRFEISANHKIDFNAPRFMHLRHIKVFSMPTRILFFTVNAEEIVPFFSLCRDRNFC